MEVLLNELPIWLHALGFQRVRKKWRDSDSGKKRSGS